MKKPKLGGVIAIALLVGVLLPAVFIFAVNTGMGVEDEYAERGIPVECRVSEVANIGRTQEVKVSYKSAEGEWIEARCIANQRVSLNQSLSGYVLPEDPYNVYCEPDTGLKVMIYVIIAGVAIGGWAPLFSTLKERSVYDKLMKNGVPCKAELTSWHKEPAGIVGQFRIFTRDGQEKIIDITAQQGAPIVGASYDIILAEGKNGKMVAVLTDENMR